MRGIASALGCKCGRWKSPQTRLNHVRRPLGSARQPGQSDVITAWESAALPQERVVAGEGGRDHIFGGAGALDPVAAAFIPAVPPPLTVVTVAAFSPVDGSRVDDKVLIDPVLSLPLHSNDVSWYYRAWRPARGHALQCPWCQPPGSGCTSRPSSLTSEGQRGVRWPSLARHGGLPRPFGGQSVSTYEHAVD